MLPESPHWLLCKKKWENLIDLLNDMNHPNIMSNKDDIPTGSSVVSTSLTQIFKVLFKPAFLKKLCSGAFLFSVTFLIYYKESKYAIIFV